MWCFTFTYCYLPYAPATFSRLNRVTDFVAGYGIAGTMTGLSVTRSTMYQMLAHAYFNEVALVST